MSTSKKRKLEDFADEAERPMKRARVTKKESTVEIEWDEKSIVSVPLPAEKKKKIAIAKATSRNKYLPWTEILVLARVATFLDVISCTRLVAVDRFHNAKIQALGPLNPLSTTAMVKAVESECKQYIGARVMVRSLNFERSKVRATQGACSMCRLPFPLPTDEDGNPVWQAEEEDEDNQPKQCMSCSYGDQMHLKGTMCKNIDDASALSLGLIYVALKRARANLIKEFIM